jgi:hypothetical protein
LQKKKATIPHCVTHVSVGYIIIINRGIAELAPSIKHANDVEMLIISIKQKNASASLFEE